jgi:lysozyme
MSGMKMGPDGLAIVKAFESCLAPVKSKPGFFTAYYDPVHVLTIGWGHTNDHLPKFDAATVWSQAQCDAALAGDTKVPLAQHEFDALVSWSFNTGGPSHASVWKAINSGNKAAVPAALALWNKAGGAVLNGLTRRRKAEGLLFQGKIKEAYAVAQAKPATTAKKAAGAVVAAGTAATVLHQSDIGTGWIIAIAVVAAIAAFVIWKIKEK